MDTAEIIIMEAQKEEGRKEGRKGGRRWQDDKRCPSFSWTKLNEKLHIFSLRRTSPLRPIYFRRFTWRKNSTHLLFTTRVVSPLLIYQEKILKRNMN